MRTDDLFLGAFALSRGGELAHVEVESVNGRAVAFFHIGGADEEVPDPGDDGRGGREDAVERPAVGQHADGDEERAEDSARRGAGPGGEVALPDRQGAAGGAGTLRRPVGNGLSRQRQPVTSAASAPAAGRSGSPAGSPHPSCW